MGDPRQTPGMQQFYRFKKRFPGCVLLFRVGDFYETFDEDAVTVSKALGLTLTKRTEGVPMAGVPFHQLEVYLRRLVGLGFRVAVADQTEDASKAKGLVKREVTQVVTPGTAVDGALLEEDAPSGVAAVCFVGDGDASASDVAVVEATTGDFRVARVPAGGLVDELARRGVREVVYADVAGDGKPPPRVARVLSALGIAGTPRPAWHFRGEESLGYLREHFGVKTFGGFGFAEEDESLIPAGALVRYLCETQTPGGDEGVERGAWAPRGTLAHLRPPRRESRAGECVVDAVSLRALEVERVMRVGAGGMAGAGNGGTGASADRSLVGLFLGSGSRGGVCLTAMGKRVLREWLCRPLGDLAAIRSRHDAVAVLVEDRRVSGEVASALQGVQDVARIASRVALDRATPRDLLGLGRSLVCVGPLEEAVRGVPALSAWRGELESVRGVLGALGAEIVGALVESPPNHLREGGAFRDGVDEALDRARGLSRDAGAWLAGYQERLARELELPGLKVGYNKVFGYYIELPSAQSKRAPAVLERTQTLKNAERYTTGELRTFEREVSGAESSGVERERELFRGVCEKVRGMLREVQGFADAAASVDALQGLAEHAHARGWTRPEMVEGAALEVDGGRHPVLEEVLGRDFVPNDVSLGVAGGGEGVGGGARLAVITGPNMAGKSTFIRQTALIVLLAHAGSFVPATRAVVGRCDRVFTRIGADDALHAGQSTFMVEMTETAAILNHCTPASLVVLDEIGRGTSTHDGLSLAWAIAERLAGEGVGEGPRTLFATHYHELTALEELLPGRVKNLHVVVKEWPGKDGHPEIVFVHRIAPGRTDQSYGVHVAKLAGLPGAVVDRAREILAGLAGGPPVSGALGGAKGRGARPGGAAVSEDGQMGLFTQYLSHPAVDRLKELKLESLSPIQAFDELRRLQEEAKGV
ncbi:MAG: DNA mismatch repair protein MutS [Phycisphaeraceae bacterium]|nr:MAG: DNA mismatch repair protein MutS [Phycisphaeraceae bacterium]